MTLGKQKSTNKAVCSWGAFRDSLKHPVPVLQFALKAFLHVAIAEALTYTSLVPL